MPKQHEDVFEDRDHAGGEHLVQRVNVAGDTRDQPANWILVEECNVQPLQVAEDLAAQVEHHLLPGPLHDVSLRELEQEAEQQDADVHAGNLRDAGQRARAEKAVEQRVGFGVAGEVFVDRDFGEIGAEHVGARLQHDSNQGDHDLQPVRVQVGQQALHQPAVVRLAQYLFFVDSSHVPGMIVNNRLKSYRRVQGEPGWKTLPEPVQLSLRNTNAEFFEPNAMQLQIACSISACRPTSGT